MIKHANDESRAAFWSSSKTPASQEEAKRVRVKVLKDRAAFGVFDASDKPVWVSDQ